MKRLIYGLSLWGAIAVAGGEVNNGGDTVRCEISNQSPYSGYYSLDFLMGQQIDNSDLVKLTSWDQSKNRLLKILADKDPDLFRLFKEYLSRVPGESTDNPDQQFIYQRIWEETPYGLVDIHDERVIKKLPPNCYHLNGDKINLIQTVIRQPKDSVIIYNFDPNLMAELKSKNPLQYSYLIIHEWLWDFTDDVDTIRRINRFLHSNKLENLNAEQLKLSLENIGLNLKFSRMKPVCQRSEPVRRGLEAYTGLQCDKIETIYSKDPSGPWALPLDLSNRGLVQLLPGDLSGLETVFGINLSSNLIDYLYADTFSGMPALKSITMNGTLIQKLPRELFALNPELELVYFGGNQISEIEEGFQVITKNLHFIDLKNNKLKSLPADFFENLCPHADTMNGLMIGLGQNPWTDIPTMQARADKCRAIHLDFR